MDLYLKPTLDGGDLVVTNGQPRLDGGLSTSVYLSLFTAPWWGNVLDDNYNSEVPEAQNNTLTNRTRLDIIESVKDALQWMINEGIAEDIEVEARIRTPSRLDLLVRIIEPEDQTDLVYSINWDNQEVALQ